jgi:type I restriction enzyme S subunit
MSPDALSFAEPSDDAAASTGLWGLPTGWAWAPASSFSTVIGGGTPRDAADPANYDTEGIPWITPADLSGYTRSHIERGARSLSQRGFANSSARLLPAGTVLFSSRAPVGYCVVASNPICTNQGFKSLVLTPDIVPEYIRYYMRFNRKYFVDNASGTTFKEVSGSVLADLLFPIAPTRQQRRIVARIDELFAEIAEGEAALERARQGLDTWRRALLKAAVTGELTRDWREANRPIETGADLLARIRAERQASAPRSGRTRRSAASGAREANSPPVLPDGWGWTTLGECISHLTSGSRDWSQYYDRGSAIFIMAQNIRPGRYNHNYVKHVAPPVGDPETTRTRVHRNDLLVTIVGANTGDVCRVDFDADNYFVCQSVALARPILSEMSGFLGLYFVARDGGRGEFEKVIYGAGRPHLSFDQLLETRVPIPSLAEMREIVERVRLEEEAAFSEQEFAGFHRDLLALRQSILKAAFEGRLMPQDPADEPSSALLARLSNGFPSNGPRRRRARATPDFPHPSLPGLTQQSADPRVEPAGDE